VLDFKQSSNFFFVLKYSYSSQLKIFLKKKTNVFRRMNNIASVANRQKWIATLLTAQLNLLVFDNNT